MGWINALCETYDRCQTMVGKEEADHSVLLPIAHSTANAQLEIIIDIEGRFLRGEEIGKENVLTIIPVTEDSATRSGTNPPPHPLCDKLCYIAGDYASYVEEKDKKEDSFKDYISALQKWSEMPTTSEKVKAVYQYLSQKTVIQDLIKENIIQLDENGYISQKDIFVRFTVEKDGTHKYTAQVWKDIELFREYEVYYMQQKKEKRLCYATGEMASISNKHPAKIRNTGDKAKIISANDKSGYTFRGRFLEANQAVSLGFEASQKAHNALRWLIHKQGWKNGSESIVSWCIDGTKIPSAFVDTQDIFAEAFPDEQNMPDIDTAASYASRLNKAMSGYKADLKTDSKIVVMSLDTADGSGQGRLAITFYSELTGTRFLENIERWHRECHWRHTYKKVGEQYKVFVGAPSPKEIAVSAYGTDQNGLLKADDKVVKSCIQRLLPCIVEGRMFPWDIMHTMVCNAGRPMSMSAYNFARVRSNTCAVIVKYRKDKYKEEWEMALNAELKDRNYLFGRLLAVADKAEERTYGLEERSRITNAKRYWEIFSKKPLKTWGIIREKIIPYLPKLKYEEGKKYENLINQITSMFIEGEFSNQSLSELYLLGYSCQLEDLRFKKSEQEKNTTENEGVNENE